MDTKWLQICCINISIVSNEVIMFQINCFFVTIFTRRRNFMLPYILKIKDMGFLKMVYRASISLVLVASIVLFTGFMRARKIVTIVDGKEKAQFLTLKTDVNEILKSKDIDIFDQDFCDVEDDGHDIKININRAVCVYLTVGTERRSIRINSFATVADVLKESGVELGADDIVNVNKEENVYNGMEICVNLVRYSLREEVVEIDFKHETENTDELYEGETRVKTAGQKGELRKRYKDKFIDGKLVGTSEEYSNVTKNPANEIILKGTKKKQVKPASKANAPAVYRKVISGKASAYTGGGFTATGKKAARGLVAVDPRKIPYGTKLYICSPDGYVYGYAVAADCGGMMINGSRLVDLYMNSEQECQRFGVRDVNIYIL